MRRGERKEKTNSSVIFIRRNEPNKGWGNSVGRGNDAPHANLTMCSYSPVDRYAGNSRVWPVRSSHGMSPLWGRSLDEVSTSFLYVILVLVLVLVC